MSSSAHDHPELGPPQLIEVADRVFGYIQPDGTWYINNTGFIVGDRSVISIDACSTERRTRAYLDRIASVTPAPVTTLVNTHHHGDHTYGNCVFGDITIIGQERCRAEIIATGLLGNTGIWEPVDWGELTLAPPTVTFTDRLRLWSGDLPVDLRYVGQPAHTSNDTLVWLPEQQVLFCGDLLFNGGTPFLLMGSVTGAIEVLTTVVAPIPAAAIVSGHGAVCGPDLIGTVVGYLRFVLEIARRGLAAGVPPLDAARDTELGEYAGWLDSERIVGNLHRAYCDLEPSRGKPDLFAALSDMVAYNGGRPLSCRA
ncbi:MAG TPA: MBL fold metallo-hydrolase [Streptosporangiaceae bacterium]|jgi:cyclase|nr:MBL fold metallo-hydrolase [Streptosporangiaceae bacterium]